ncbi:MAG: neutral/alkaline non-lysosomal ceramidase N-terminal domain-containing protein [Thermomicrobiales bacterium]|nr:neutral/alkaline non-lysosomal ceramidase N-terminal domain-containing protein [Thermomicrobiales bacterium]
MSTFRAGVGRVGITQPLTMPHAAWGAQVHVFPEGIEWPMYATALVLDDGETRVVWLDLDLGAVTVEEFETIRPIVAEIAGIDPAMVRITVTHNHAGPPRNAWNWSGQGQSAWDAYFEALPHQAAGATRAAMANLRPAVLNAGSGESRVAVNRREVAPSGRPVTGSNADGPIDPEVLVVRIDGEDGSPLAAIVGYTMHPTTLGPTNKQVSPDWPGHTRATVEELTGATCLIVQGCAGNVGPGFDGYTDDLNVVRTIGKRVGCVAAEVYHGLDVPAVDRVHERVWESGAPLSTWKKVPRDAGTPRIQLLSKTVDLPLIEQPSLEETAKLVESAEAHFEALKAAGAPDEEIALATFVVKRSNMAHQRAERFGGKTHTATTVQVLMVGDIALAGTQGEPFVEIALAVKSRSPLPGTWFGGYTGPWLAYIPTAGEYPKGGYEVDTTPFAPEAAGILVDESVRLLEGIAERRRFTC